MFYLNLIFIVFTLSILQCSLIHPEVVDYDNVKVSFLTPTENDTLLDSIHVKVKIDPFDGTMDFSLGGSYPALNVKKTVNNMSAIFETWVSIPESSGTYILTANALRQTGGLPNYKIISSSKIKCYVKPIIKRFHNSSTFSTYAMAEDSNGMVWISSTNGIQRFNGRIVEQISSWQYRSHTLAVDPTGRIWADSIQPNCSFCLGFISVFNGAMREKTFTAPFSNGDHCYFTFDQNGKFYAIGSCAECQLYVMENDSIVYASVPRMSSCSRMVRANPKEIAFDKKNDLWMTTNTDVRYFTQANCYIYDKTNTNWPQSNANNLHVDKNGRVWVQFETHIAFFENNAWTTYYTAADQNSIIGMAIDRNGDVWLLTKSYEAAIMKLHNGTVVRNISEGSSYEGKIIACRNGTIAIACYTDLLFINEHGFPEQKY